jgi:hypothetical protein
MCCKRRAFPVKVSATSGTGPDNASISAETTADLSTAYLTAVLGEVLIYLDPRLFAPAVNPSVTPAVCTPEAVIHCLRLQVS